MQAASRQSLGSAAERMAQHLDDADRAAAEGLSDELFGVLGVLDRERGLRQHLSDIAVPAAERARLAEAVFSGKVSVPALDTVRNLASARWSRPRDLVDAVESLARRAALAVAGKDDVLEEVEDELFRLSRLLEREPHLRGLVDDPSTPADRRAELIRSLIAGKVHQTSERLLTRAVQVPRGRTLMRAAEQLAELAAASRERYVAHVSTPVALTSEQEQRLAAALSRIYRRQISLQVELEPERLGGLVVRVGDEVIDGSVASHLQAARQRLPQ